MNDDVITRFETRFAYKFDHKQGCSFYSDTAAGEMCSCGAMKEANQFIQSEITKAKEEKEKEWIERCDKMFK